MVNPSLAKTGFCIAALVGLLSLFQNCGRFSANSPQSLQLSSNGKEQIIVDDMILNEDEINWGKGGSSSLVNQAASGLPTYNSKRWTNGIVPVEFDPTIQGSYRDIFFAACQVWADKTPIRCVLRTNESNYLYVTDDTPNACHTQVGAGYGGRRTLNFSQDWCWQNRPGVVHEIGHVLGLMHEHQRPDRDQYIQINTQNILSGFVFAFDKFQTAGVEQSNYDFESIMHYHAWSYAKVPGGALIANATMIAKPPYVAKTSTMGYATTVSLGDIGVINWMYPVPTIVNTGRAGPRLRSR